MRCCAGPAVWPAAPPLRPPVQAAVCRPGLSLPAPPNNKAGVWLAYWGGGPECSHPASAALSYSLIPDNRIRVDGSTMCCKDTINGCFCLRPDCSLLIISNWPHIIKSFIYTRCLLETIIFSSQAVHLLLPYSYCHSVIISAFYRSQYVYWFPATTPAEQYYNPRMRSYTLWLFWLQQLPVIKSCTERHKCCLCIQCLEPGNSGYCVAWCSRQL